MNNLTMQNLNRKTMQYLINNISVGMSLKEIKDMCEKYMLENGADSFWYWNVGALIFSGDETTMSISGKRYKVANRIITNNDIITIDLSPQNNKYWGDFARTIIIENSKVINDINNIQNQEWKNGLLMEKYLHERLIQIVTDDMTFEELYYIMNDIIKKKGFVNLDFLGNLGHSIVKNQEERIYIEKGNQTQLSKVNMFTFEPHISMPNSKYGYKREDIYYFKENKLIKL